MLEVHSYVLRCQGEDLNKNIPWPPEVYNSQSRSWTEIKDIKYSLI